MHMLLSLVLAHASSCTDVWNFEYKTTHSLRTNHSLQRLGCCIHTILPFAILYTCGEMTKFTVCIVDQGMQEGREIPEPQIFTQVKDMHIADFIKDVMYKKQKHSVHNWVQPDASVAILKNMAGTVVVQRNKKLSYYIEDDGDDTVSFILEPPRILTHAAVSVELPSTEPLSKRPRRSTSASAE
jgi:hypothetical protein